MLSTQITMRNKRTGCHDDWPALVEAARQGDDGAFGQICDRMMEYLLLTASDLGGGVNAKLGASDIVQQALLEARQDITDFQGSTESELRIWLARLVRHNLIDSVRHYRRTQRRDISRERPARLEELADQYGGSHKTASSIVCHRETDDELLRAVAQLSARRQRVIELRHWEGLSFAEIGSVLGISEDASRQLSTRAIDELRRKLAVNHADRPA